MSKVYVVFYDEVYPGFGERGANQRRIECVVDSEEKARTKVRELEKYPNITYADFDVFDVE